MGKVYEFSEIAEHRVPLPLDFLTAKKLALDNLSVSVRNGEIYGAKVFGSVAKGTPNERSDFDIVIITENDTALAFLKEKFTAIKARTRVGIEPIVVSREFAENGNHSIDLLFLKHIRSISDEDNVVGRNPLDVLNPCSDLPPTLVLKQYLIQKIRRFSEGAFVDSKEDSNRLLQRALEEPVNLGRRILQILPQVGQPLDMKDDGKKEVIELFRETFRNTPLIYEFSSLVEKDAAYTNLLRKALQGVVLQKEYEIEISKLSSSIPQALNWTNEVMRSYVKLLEGNKKGIEGSLLYRGKESL